MAAAWLPTPRRPGGGLGGAPAIRYHRGRRPLAHHTGITATPRTPARGSGGRVLRLVAQLRGLADRRDRHRARPLRPVSGGADGADQLRALRPVAGRECRAVRRSCSRCPASSRPSGCPDHGLLVVAATLSQLSLIARKFLTIGRHPSSRSGCGHASRASGALCGLRQASRALGPPPLADDGSQCAPSRTGAPAHDAPGQARRVSGRL